MRFHNYSIIRLLRLIAFGVLILSFVITGIIWWYNIEAEFNRYTEAIREHDIEFKKEALKYQVMYVVKFIDKERDKAYRYAQDELKAYIDKIANLSGESFSLIRSILPDYMGFFVYNPEDKSFHFPTVKPDFNIAVKGEKFVFPDSVISYWRKSNYSHNVVGGWISVKEIESRIKREILFKIADMRFGKEGYIFVNRFDGTALVSNGKVLSGKRKLWEEFTFSNVKEVFKKELKAASHQEGGYIYYRWVKLTDPSKVSSKVSFVYGYKRWKWIVGAGVYLDDVEKKIQIFHSLLNMRIESIVKASALTVFSVFILLAAVFHKLSQHFNRDIEEFISFFKEAVSKNSEVVKEKINIKEFKELAEWANIMLSERVKVEQELLREKEKFRTILYSIGDAVIFTDPDSRIVFLNKIAEELTEWSYEEAKGKKLEDVFKIVNAFSRKKVENPVEKVLREGKIVGLANHTLLISKTGKEYHIADSAAPVKDENGKILGVILVFRDETEKIKMQQEIMRAEKFKSLSIVAGGIAHDFNNILTGIAGNIQLAKVKIEKTHPSYIYLESTEKSIERAMALTHQLLTFAKEETPSFKSFDISEMVKEVVDFHLRGSNIKAVFDVCEEGVCRVKGDRGQLSQVISNIVINAKDAMPYGGRIFVRLSNISEEEAFKKYGRKERMVKIEIKDEGEGISDEVIGKIFEPFFSTKKDGSGLGLAIAYSIVEKHNGIIEVSSEKGKGTTFKIVLPASSEKEIEEKTERMDTSGDLFKGLKVLVMDDDINIRTVTKEMLSQFGADVDEAEDAEIAIDKIKAKKYDVIIADLTVPGGKGAEYLIEKLLENRIYTKVIVASGYFSDEMALNYKDMGFSGVISKPFKFQELMKKIEEVLSE